MELVLNLVWVVLATLMCWQWMRLAPPAAKNRRMQGQRDDSRGMQLVALAVLLLIMFPVISVTDDLQAMQNPAETDSCLRRSQTVAAVHSVLSAVTALPLPAYAGIAFGYLRMTIPGSLPAPLVDHPALASIQNRPPPVA